MVKEVICNDGTVVLIIRRGKMILILGMPLPAPENQDETLFSASKRAKWPGHLMLMEGKMFSVHSRMITLLEHELHSFFSDPLGRLVL